MKPLRAVVLVSTILSAATSLAADAAIPSASAQTSPRFVAIYPCRILDTATMPPANAAEERLRRIDLTATRCGRVVPPYALTISVRITNLSRELPERIPPNAAPLVESRQIPLQPGTPLELPVPGTSHIQVDIDGYFVPPGTAVNPFDAAASSATAPPEAAAQSATARPATPVAQTIQDGTAGQIYLDASVHPNDGVLMTAAAASPWIVAKTGTTNAASGFAVASSTNVELMRVRGDGAVQLSSSSAFFDGRSDYFGSPGSYYGYQPIPTNVVHDVTLVNPRDRNNQALEPITFFNAQTDGENGSPAVTKYRAYTNGYNAQENVNFDSAIWYHRGTAYHYRARSAVENKDTFWVREATSQDSVTNTRADLFLSGNVGIGSVPSSYKLLLTGGRSVFQAGAEQFALGLRYSGANGNAQFWIGATNSATPDLVLSNTNGTEIARFKHGGGATLTGTVSAANIQAHYQDVAEWVPSLVDMEPGTVVILNPDARNEVMPSQRAYDTSVAGVVSAQPGLILGEGGADKEQIATTGRVRVKVDATAAPIRVGDLLVTGHKPGTAMRSIPIDLHGTAIHRPGTIVGKALEPLENGEGEILVLLSLQ